ncbi:ferritin-like domain-containing protein [Corallococcus sp. CA054B]|uniref:ferritin-like domain-containing protein n=1 Tax=Corallococcus sp. CA054B TaxID=2316734 RepID=UPI000EA149C2|nr:ferritin-like domain-containing protein [Corallococcus sp. CA054B]RKG67588.1 ferritin-like domain-containing protein [Corallococcus sp. CA054B]
MSVLVRILEHEEATVAPSPLHPREGRPAILTELYEALTRRGLSLVDITWEQQRLHESRRWSVVEMLAQVDFAHVGEADRHMVWNAGRAELTTKPGADRLERLADQECRRWQEQNPTVAAIMQACGTWSRYWNEEEAHHETAFNRLSTVLRLEPITDATFMEFRKVFPDDDMLRTLTLLSISEVVAAVDYGQCSQMVQDPGLRALFKQVAADEVQHMNYFIAFAKALVDSGAYKAKEAFAVAHLFLRDGGEVHGSKREHVESRETHVNWWDQVRHREGFYAPDALRKKEQLIFHALKRITGITVTSRDELENTWMDLVGC